MFELSYISRHANKLPLHELIDIRVKSNLNNERNKIGGELISFGGMFYQTLRGDEKKVKALFEKIKTDKRHTDVTMLETKYIGEQKRPHKWGMEFVNLDRLNKKVLKPVSQMLSRILVTYDDIKRHKQVLENYTPERVVKLMDEGKKPYEEPLVRTYKTVMFTDIVGFSSMTQRLDESEIMDVLNTYSSIVVNAVQEHGGEIGKFLGDGIMTYFGDTTSDAAINAAMTILDEMEALRKDHSNDILGILYCGIGVAWGEVIMGNMGSKNRKDYTIIGDVVNTASKIESATRTFEKPLLITCNTYDNSTLRSDFIKCGSFSISERSSPVELYTLDSINASAWITPNDFYSLLYHKLEAEEPSPNTNHNL